MRVKRGVTKHARHQKIRRGTKGMTKAHRSSIRRGNQAINKSLQYAYRDRRNRKRTFRQLWNARINLDRKVLAELAVNEPQAFEEVIKAVKASK
jgi:large subunit ribosomal protein L20